MCQMDKEVERTLGKLKTDEDETKYEEDCLQDKCGVASGDHTKIQAWQGKMVLPQYVGCLKEEYQSQYSQNMIGQNITMKNCFDQARKMGYNFAGLTNGTNCHAYSEYGDMHKGRVNDA